MGRRGRAATPGDTTGDITDTWQSLNNIGFSQAGHEKLRRARALERSGHADRRLRRLGAENLHPTRLTPNEQYTHISLWCLLCAPLLIGCDMTRLDDFTLNLLTNDEVLAVNQDPLGQQAGRVVQDGDFEVRTKQMADGSKAVGLFNRGEIETKHAVKWSDLGLQGKQIVRDVWRQKDLGDFDGQFETSIPRHGVVLIRLRERRERLGLR